MSAEEALELQEEEVEALESIWGIDGIYTADSNTSYQVKIAPIDEDDVGRRGKLGEWETFLSWAVVFPPAIYLSSGGYTLLFINCPPFEKVYYPWDSYVSLIQTI